MSDPHHGQDTSWTGEEPLRAPRLPSPCSSSSALAAAAVRLGVTLEPTHIPIRNGASPQSPGSSRRISSQAQMSAAARWNCWEVSRRSV